METYIFYTPEGFTQSPKNIDVENLQILGFSEGETYAIALDSLLQQNTWIAENGYDILKIKGVRVLSDG